MRMNLFDYLAGEHRRIEAPLDRFLQALRSGAYDGIQQHFQDAARLAERHFELEESILFPAVRSGFAALVAKMEAEHGAVREAASALEATFSAGVAADLARLGRHFQAMLQHHLIEEERDFFPLLARWLSEKDQEALLGAFCRGHA